MYIWLILCVVALGLSVFLNIELWSIAKELKTEIVEINGYTNYDRPVAPDDNTAE